MDKGGETRRGGILRQKLDVLLIKLGNMITLRIRQEIHRPTRRNVKIAIKKIKSICIQNVYRALYRENVYGSRL